MLIIFRIVLHLSREVSQFYQLVNDIYRSLMKTCSQQVSLTITYDSYIIFFLFIIEEYIS